MDAYLLCDTGGHGTTLNDNLLHFAIQYQLDGMAEILTKHIPKNKDVLWQVSSTKKTPFEMAKKNKMVNVMNTLEQLQVSKIYVVAWFYIWTCATVSRHALDHKVSG